jgi:hypothetical protein
MAKSNVNVQIAVDAMRLCVSIDHLVTFPVTVTCATWLRPIKSRAGR